MRPRPVKPGPGQESVWDYPRPPRLEDSTSLLVVVFADTIVAETRRARRVLETSHPPTYYIPAADVRTESLRLERDDPGTACEWKGRARYFDLVVGTRLSLRAVWCYPQPVPPFEPIRGHFAFYAGRVDACFVDGQPARPQPGGFYGGWVTDLVVGPFKGVPGSWGW